MTEAVDKNAPMWVFASLGAVGGLGSFFLSRLLNVGPFIQRPIYFDLPGEVLLGAVAALFGVYLLTATDKTSRQTWVYALACGLCWSPIVSVTQQFVIHRTDNQTASTAQSARDVSAKISSQPEERADQTKKEAAAGITTALGKLPSVSTTNARNAIVDSSTDVVNNLATQKVDSTSVQALKEIGLASARADTTQLSLITIQKLSQIAGSDPSAGTRDEAKLAADAVAKVSVLTDIPANHFLPTPRSEGTVK